jgi:hypothetical protein
MAVAGEVGRNGVPAFLNSLPQDARSAREAISANVPRTLRVGEYANPSNQKT